MIGSYVRDLRVQRDLSQAELATAARLSRRTVVYIEQGDITRPMLLTAQRIATALGVALDDICEPTAVSA